MIRRAKSPSLNNCQQVRVGAAAILIPSGLHGQLLSLPDCSVNCLEFVARSPERTIYHSSAYIGFARHENGAADMLVVSSHGNPVFAIPIHPDSRGRWLSTGYSGALFPEDNRETVLRASGGALQRFLAVNRSLGFRAEQSVQAPGYDSAERMALIARLLWDPRNEVRPAYARVLRISMQADKSRSDMFDTNELLLDNPLLAQYDGDVRNQIRQALRRGLRVRISVLDNVASHAETQDVYRRYLPVHVESYARTGLTAHTIEYWLGLSAAVQNGGGTDVVVLVTDESGIAVAGVTCHAFRGRAIYWSGGSTTAGKANRANPLALHAAITTCASRGVTAFELGRFDACETSEKECAITHYKAQFRGGLVPVVNFVRPPQSPRGQLGTLVRGVRASVDRLMAAYRTEKIVPG